MNIFKIIIINIFIILLLCVLIKIVKTTQKTFLTKTISFFKHIFVFFSFLWLIVVSHRLNVYDYSETNSESYDKIVFAENDSDPKDTAYYVYLKNGCKYKIRTNDLFFIKNNECYIKVNNDYMQNCFVPKMKNTAYAVNIFINLVPQRITFYMLTKSCTTK